RRRHTRWPRDWSSDVCSSDLAPTATAKETLSRNAPSGTTRMSVGEDPLQASLGLGECFLEVIELLAESEADVVREAEVVARHQRSEERRVGKERRSRG